MSGTGQGRSTRCRTRRSAAAATVTSGILAGHSSTDISSAASASGSSHDALSTSKGAEADTNMEARDSSGTASTSAEGPSDGAPLTSRATASPDPHCAICLGALENKSFTDSCFHMFCFVCLQEWSKIKAECPLCKQPFKSIIHNVTSYDKFDQFVLERNHPPPRPMPYSWSIDASAVDRRFRYRTTLTMDHHYISLRHSLPFHSASEIDPSFQRPSYLQRPDRSRPLRPVSTSEFRRHIYESGRRVVAVKRTQRHRLTSPTWFRENPAQTHRLIPWLNRELNALLYNMEHQVAFVMELILDMIKRFPIDSEEFFELIHPYLRRHTRHFMHEFLTFARSPFTMHVYDTKAVYGTPGTGIGTSEGSSNDSDVVVVDDDDAEEAGRPGQEPASPRIHFDPGSSAYQMSASFDPLRGRYTGAPTLDLASSGWDSPTPGPSWDLSDGRGSLTAPVNVDDSGSSDDSTIIDPTSPRETPSSHRQITHSSDDEAVIFVSYDKPWEERSPIKLSSSEDESARFVRRLKREHKKKKSGHDSLSVAAGSSRYGRQKERRSRSNSSPSGHRSKSSSSRSLGRRTRSRKSRHPEKKSRKRHRQSYESSLCSESPHKKPRHMKSDREGRSCSQTSSQGLPSKKHKRKKHKRSKDLSSKEREKYKEHNPGPSTSHEPSAAMSASAFKGSSVSGSSSEKCKKHPSGHKKSRAKESLDSRLQASDSPDRSLGSERAKESIDSRLQVSENPDGSPGSERAKESIDSMLQVSDNRDRSQGSERSSDSNMSEETSTSCISKHASSSSRKYKEDHKESDNKALPESVETDSESRKIEKVSDSGKIYKVSESEDVSSGSSSRAPDASTSQAAGDASSSSKASDSTSQAAGEASSSSKASDSCVVSTVPKPIEKHDCWSESMIMTIAAAASVSSSSDTDSFDSYSSDCSSDSVSVALSAASSLMINSNSGESSLRSRCERVAQVLSERRRREVEARRREAASCLYHSWSLNTSDWHMNMLNDMFLRAPPHPSTSTTEPVVIDSDDSDVEPLSPTRPACNDTPSGRDLHVEKTVVVPCTSTLDTPTPAVDLHLPSTSAAYPFTVDDDESNDMCVDVESISSDSLYDSEVVDVESLEDSTEDDSGAEVIDVVGCIESRAGNSRHSSLVEVSAEPDTLCVAFPSVTLSASISEAFSATPLPKPVSAPSFSIESILSKDVFMGPSKAAPSCAAVWGTDLPLSGTPDGPSLENDLALQRLPLHSPETGTASDLCFAGSVTSKNRVPDPSNESISTVNVTKSSFDGMGINEDYPAEMLDRDGVYSNPPAHDSCDVASSDSAENCNSKLCLQSFLVNSCANAIEDSTIARDTEILTKGTDKSENKESAFKKKSLPSKTAGSDNFGNQRSQLDSHMASSLSPVVSSVDQTSATLIQVGCGATDKAESEATVKAVVRASDPADSLQANGEEVFKAVSGKTECGPGDPDASKRRKGIGEELQFWDKVLHMDVGHKDSGDQSNGSFDSISSTCQDEEKMDGCEELYDAATATVSDAKPSKHPSSASSVSSSLPDAADSDASYLLLEDEPQTDSKGRNPHNQVLGQFQDGNMMLGNELQTDSPGQNPHNRVLGQFQDGNMMLGNELQTDSPGRNPHNRVLGQFQDGNISVTKICTGLLEQKVGPREVTVGASGLATMDLGFSGDCGQF